MITITNKLVISILFSPVPTTMNNRCCFINSEQHCWNNSKQHIIRSLNNIVIVETIVNNIIRWTLFSHDNRVVKASFNQLNAVTTSIIFSCLDQRLGLACKVRLREANTIYPMMTCALWQNPRTFWILLVDFVWLFKPNFIALFYDGFQRDSLHTEMYAIGIFLKVRQFVLFFNWCSAKTVMFAPQHIRS